MPEDKYKDHIYALIVVGGGGTRLWPRSRNASPKQFLKLFNKQSLTQITSNRLHKILDWEKIFVVTTTYDYKREILKEVPDLIAENIICEPSRRNTAPAHALGAIYIYSKDPDAVIINDYADHLMNPEKIYLRNMGSAALAAYKGDYLLATGIRPTYPNIGYGYIKRGERVDLAAGKIIYKLDKFTEKPDLATAEKYLKSGDYLWNAGQFVWRADSILKALEKYAPDIYKPLQGVVSSLGKGKEEEEKAIAQAYEQIPEISIDYAIAEKADNFITFVADYQWTDIGDWKEVWENLPKDSVGNVVIDGDEEGGRVINIDTSDALIHTNGRLIAIVDVDNICIVDTHDALLVCAKSRAQNVKKIVEQLKKEKKKEYL